MRRLGKPKIDKNFSFGWKGLRPLGWPVKLHHGVISQAGFVQIPTIKSGSIPIYSQPRLRRLALKVARALVTYPYFTVVKGFNLEANEAELKALVREVGALARTKRELPEKLSFTRVSVNPDAVQKTKKVTAYSRTHLPLAPHTDSSYLPTPHDLVAFQCVVADAEGGANAMVAADDVTARLTAAEIHRLRAPVFPFSRGHAPILWDGPAGLCIRYYRTQIDQAIADGAHLGADDVALLDRFDQLIADEAHAFTFKLQEGEAVIFNNKRILHARKGFEAASRRTLFRVRYNVNLDRAAARPVGLWARLANKFNETPVLPEVGNTGFVATPSTVQDRVLQLEAHLEAKPTDAGAAKALANLLAECGRFTDARTWVDRSLTLLPDDHDSLVLSSALHWALGARDAAQRDLKRLAAAHPFMAWDNGDGAGVTLLRTRGLKNVKYRLVERGGRFTPSFEGGHFSTSHLVDLDDYQVIDQHVFDQASPYPAGMPTPDLMLNTVACGDRMPDALAALAAFLEGQPNLPVINHPARILDSTRERNAARLGAIDGVVFPKTLRLSWDKVRSGAVLDNMQAAGLRYPLIVRPVETHTGVDAELIADAAALERYFAAALPDRAYYLIQYHDLADDLGLHRKTRTFCIDGRYYPVASLVHTGWNVHSGDRYSVMNKNQDFQQAEQAYLTDMAGWLGSDHVARLEAIREIMGLDFFGIDFYPMPDGRLFIFECNAAMRHNFDHAGAFPYTRPHLERVSRAFADMVAARSGQVRSSWLKLQQRVADF